MLNKLLTVVILTWPYVWFCATNLSWLSSSYKPKTSSSCLQYVNFEPKNWRRM